MKKRIIGIFGWEQADICIYLASILENMKQRVLVIDNSFEQKIQLCIPKPKEQLEIVTYKNVDYTSHWEHSMWKSVDYDYLLVNLGNNPMEEDLEFCQEIICVLSCEAFHIRAYQQFIQEVKKPFHLVFRNYCKNYMDTNKILHQLGETSCFLVDKVFLPFIEMDECLRVLMQVEGYRSLSGLSKEFEKAIFRLCRAITNQDFTAVLNGLRRAKRGECF